MYTTTIVYNLSDTHPLQVLKLYHIISATTQLLHRYRCALSVTLHNALLPIICAGFAHVNSVVVNNQSHTHTYMYSKIIYVQGTRVITKKQEWK